VQHPKNAERIVAAIADWHRLKALPPNRAYAMTASLEEWIALRLECSLPKARELAEWAATIKPTEDTDSKDLPF
jgi:hypothetical protein